MPFLFIINKLAVIKMFLSSSQHYDIIALSVILNPNIFRENIALIITFSHPDVRR